MISRYVLNKYYLKEGKGSENQVGQENFQKAITRLGCVSTQGLVSNRNEGWGELERRELRLCV